MESKLLILLPPPRPWWQAGGGNWCKVAEMMKQKNILLKPGVFFVKIKKIKTGMNTGRKN